MLHGVPRVYSSTPPNYHADHVVILSSSLRSDGFTGDRKHILLFIVVIIIRRYNVGVSEKSEWPIDGRQRYSSPWVILYFTSYQFSNSGKYIFQIIITSLKYHKVWFFTECLYNMLHIISSENHSKLFNIILSYKAKLYIIYLHILYLFNIILYTSRGGPD